MSRRFTLHEAEGLIPRLSSLLRDAVDFKNQFEEAEQSFQGFLQRVTWTGGMIVDREHATSLKTRRERVAEKLKKVLEEIQETGCLVKDLDIGLVDFPTVFRGEEVFLCWRLGESEIGFWHGIHEGFAGRKPIDQEFRDHHEGDKPH